VITNVSPTNGAPGTQVTITGQNLDSTTTVQFNGVVAAFNVFGFSVFATVPDNATTGPITVFTPAGTVNSPTFTVINPLAPQIAGFTPNAGPAGTVVTITGTNLNSATQVRLGSVAAAFTPVSNSQLQATVPSAASTGAWTVNTAAGQAISSDLFFVSPKILNFAPQHGPVGTPVTITGVNLSGAIAVQFAGVNASFTNVSPTEIITAVPDGATSGVISVATPAGFAGTDGNFLLPPKITVVSPPSGPTATVVTIMGEPAREYVRAVQRPRG